MSLFQCLNRDGIALGQQLYDRIKTFREPGLAATSGTESVIIEWHHSTPIGDWQRAYIVNLSEKRVYMHNVIQGDVIYNPPKYLKGLKVLNPSTNMFLGGRMSKFRSITWRNWLRTSKRA